MQEDAEAVWHHIHTKTGEIRLLQALRDRRMAPEDLTEDLLVELAVNLARTAPEFNDELRRLLLRIRQIEEAP